MREKDEHVPRLYMKPINEPKKISITLKLLQKHLISIGPSENCEPNPN
jgi:hypothetical protein